ncbi:MAG TPA: terminase [Candidatus Intestinimonas stercorigallinarum]|nr:terminase [Candidatus Intestinimonas stercorigallinarum]
MAMLDRAAGQFVCDFVERLPTTGTGKPFQLYDWQRDALMDFYSTLEPDGESGELLRQYQYLYLEIPKKNGKSELAAALGLYHLFGDGELNAEVYLCAADRDNASIVFRAAVFMLETAPWTAKMIARGELKITKSKKQIEYRQLRRAENGGKRWVTVGLMAVLSAEAFSKHGYKPSCVIFDELHAQPNRALWDVMTGAAGAAHAQPVWIVLTTAGDDPDRKSIGWEIHERAAAIRDARQLRQILAQGGDPRQVLSLRRAAPEELEQAQEALLARDESNWLPILYGLTALYGDDPEALEQVDIWDESLWRLCNPSLGKHLTLRTLRLEAQAAKRSQAAEKLFRWLRLNQWISVKAVGWVPLTLYDKTQFNRPEWAGLNVVARRQAVRDWLQGKQCYGGLDLSKSTDLTAFVLLFPPQPGLETWVALFWAWRPEDGVEEAEQRDHVPYQDWARAGFLELCEGDIVDYSRVEEVIREAADAFDLITLGLDPAMSWTLSQRLMQGGIEVLEISQTMLGMSPATKKLEVLIRAHQMLHEHNTCARWNFGNVRCAVDGNENMKPIKDRSTGRIDITVAWIIAMATAMVKEAAKPDLAAAMERPGFSL